MNKFNKILNKLFLNFLFIPSTLFLIQACSIPEKAQKLSNSFDKPVESETQNDSERKLNYFEPLPDRNNNFTSKTFLENKSENNSSNDKTKIKSKKEYTYFNQADLKTIENKTPSKYPYRIIIRLLDVNPSAPSEDVTRALREAGVIFEVEKIEKYENKNLTNVLSEKR
tara:strand:- start:343 stop:849 length:507 start_codon:yes stop_codon:yes gene_type:complete